MIQTEEIAGFEQALRREERAEATIYKYVREIRRLQEALQGRELTKEALLAYRDACKTCSRPGTVNGKLSAINAFLKYTGRENLCLRLLRVQRRAFREEKRDLGEKEYKRLLHAAELKGNERLRLLIMTLGGTGMRISELSSVTVEAVKKGIICISLKGKSREILLLDILRTRLLEYAKERRICKGCIFCTRSGRPMDRSNIFHEMKQLSDKAEVPREKIFPHNLRHLFAKAYYAKDNNLAHLADILGHSSIETTRLYVAESLRSYEKNLARMKLVC